jgi:nitroreductase
MSELWDPWEISEGAFPKKGATSDKLRYLLNYAVLAPSGHNTQPWLFKIVDEQVELYADRTRALPVCDPEDRELITACGAALFHLRIALRHFGYEGKVDAFPGRNEPDLLARVGFGGKGKATAEEELLFNAILKRRTNRTPFDAREVPEKILSELKEAASREHAWLEIMKEQDKRNKVADLVAEGDRIQMADPIFRRELAAWIHQNRSVSHDGMPGYAFGLGGLASSFAPIVVRTFDMGKGQAAKDRQLATESPVLAVLGTDDDAPEDWLSAGQALDRVLLRARAEEIWASFLNQPIEVPELRPKFRSLLGRKGHPQLLLRMGYGQDTKPTPRRTAGEVLLRPLR